MASHKTITLPDYNSPCEYCRGAGSLDAIDEDNLFEAISCANCAGSGYELRESFVRITENDRRIAKVCRDIEKKNRGLYAKTNKFQNRKGN